MNPAPDGPPIAQARSGVSGGVWWLVTALLALAAFAYVQDRVTAAGAVRYVRAQRQAVAGQGTWVRPDVAMQPAIDRSVKAGVAAASGVVLLSGLLRLARLRTAGRP